jgi:hypothetical protein
MALICGLNWRRTNCLTKQCVGGCSSSGIRLHHLLDNSPLPRVIDITNILVCAASRRSPFHTAALSRVAELAEGSADQAVPWAAERDFSRFPGLTGLNPLVRARGR